MRTISTTVPARTGLAGHPSDAFAGAVLATPIAELAATVTVNEADTIVVGDRGFDSLRSVVAADHRGESMLLTAAVARLTAWLHEHDLAVPDAGFSMACETTIPRSVGLAGSSALVVGALRSLASFWDITVPDDEGPRLALETETALLGIAAGPQDRIVQWHAATVFIDFAADPWSIRHVRPPSPVELLVCWTDVGRTPSHITHAPLQARRSDPDVIGRMAALRVLGQHGAAALEAGDLDELGRCMDASFEHRRALVPLEAAHVDMVEQLHSRGAAATYTGSGGAVVALAADLEPLRAWAASRGLGAVTTTVG